MLSDDQKKIIAADQLKKQPLETVTAAFFLQVCEANLKANMGFLMENAKTVIAMPIETGGKMYMAEASIIFKPI